jgi:hypothetical protein
MIKQNKLPFSPFQKHPPNVIKGDYKDAYQTKPNKEGTT